MACLQGDFRIFCKAIGMVISSNKSTLLEIGLDQSQIEQLRSVLPFDIKS